ncbi:AraC family transcriptional regulator [Algoriphagus lacus]|uniref:AraC family transcriptional regulator n=1 Tax=Algoriphagus lacus TaxID=2056311 RepID=A0A418PNH8_9BACT|nr:DJ-1/PfpI family protein [Algoriphagus lacus]RIW13442.1 AraC family transcriptional regulator [Algoriphagus lacus]
MVRKIVFVIPPAVELLDLAGPMQVFEEAKFYGFELELEFYSLQNSISSAVGLPFGNIPSFLEAELKQGDFLFIPGVDFEVLEKLLETELIFFDWLANCYQKQVIICSVCNAALFLGKAGLLDNRECTTHWRRVELMQMLFPKAKVLNDVLFVKSDTIYTSAGISAGIDLALSVLEELTNPLFVNKVARGLVVYHRRSHQHTQANIYLDYRNHINPKVHQIQDYLTENLSTEITIESLASMVNTSPRNLSRIFKEATQITILDFLTGLRLEKAKTLKSNPEYTIDYIAAQCGFKSARQLQRILKK